VRQYPEHKGGEQALGSPHVSEMGGRFFQVGRRKGDRVIQQKEGTTSSSAIAQRPREEKKSLSNSMPNSGNIEKRRSGRECQSSLRQSVKTNGRRDAPSNEHGD